jgi:hypothetical protein
MRKNPTVAPPVALFAHPAVGLPSSPSPFSQKGEGEPETLSPRRFWERGTQGVRGVWAMIIRHRHHHRHRHHPCRRCTSHRRTE